MEPDDRARRVPAVEYTIAPPSPVVSYDDDPGLHVLIYDQDFESFYVQARDPLARALAVTLGDRDLAVEAVDEAMARAFQRWARVSRLHNPGGWVYRVGLNWATSVLRRRRRPVPPSMHPVQITDLPAPGEPSVIAALAELDVRHRSVVVCRYLLGWSEAETAAALSTRPGTVKSRLHRASRQLSVRLSHLRDERSEEES
jgi:DNA-directed RNA polymerase specialized sigma24 family protein